MESLFSMIEGPKFTEVSSLEQINQQTMQDFLSEIAIWDFYEMTREEYTNKSADDKKLLILKYYNQLLSGISLLFVSLLFRVCCSVSSSGLVLIIRSLPRSGLISITRSLPVSDQRFSDSVSDSDSEQLLQSEP